jgi:DNA repair protein RecN (Recombination protein N)
VAQAIAEKLHHLSQTHQILCVTHQPIIAAIADQHFHVEKAVVSNPVALSDAQSLEDRTVVRIQRLTEEQRPQELAQLAGGSVTDQMLAFATSLLAQAHQIRSPQPIAESKPLSKPSRTHVKATKRAS